MRLPYFLVVTVLGLLLPSVTFSQEWSRGIDSMAMGTFWRPSNITAGLSLNVTTAKNQWPQMNCGEMALGSIALGDSTNVQYKQVAANGGLRKYRVTSEGSSFDLTVNLLSPALLIESQATKITLFNMLPSSKVEAPSHFACMEGDAVKIHGRDTPAKGGMSAPYVLAWFADSKGFKDRKAGATHGVMRTGIDVPCLVVFQKKPAAVTLSAQGLTIDFGATPMGYVQVMPLYGTKRIFSETTVPWAQAIPQEVLDRCRQWTAWSRHYPIFCKEEYRVDANRDVHIRETFDYLDIADDWNTPGAKLSILPPVLGIALMFGRQFNLPLTTSPVLNDLAYYTARGPLYGIGEASYSFSLKEGWKYVDDILSVTPAKDALSQRALDRLNAQVERILKDPADFKGLSCAAYYVRLSYGGLNEQIFALSQVLPFLKPELQDAVKSYLKQKVSRLLQDERQMEIISITTPAGPLKTCSANPPWGPGYQLRDFGNGLTLAALWAYGHYTGDWDLLKTHRSRIDQMADGSFANHHWAYACNVGCTSWQISGDAQCAQIDGLIGYARLMKQMGDTDRSGKAGYLAIKQLLSLYANFFGADYLALPWGGKVPGTMRFDGNFAAVFPEHLAKKTNVVFQTKSCWVEQPGIVIDGDPTLFLSPWAGLFGLAHDEVYRFWHDQLKGEMSDLWDFVMFLYPELFNQFSADKYNNWGGITPYYQVKGLVLDGSPEWMEKNLPWPEVIQDPYYLQNLRMILSAAGKKNWISMKP